MGPSYGSPAWPRGPRPGPVSTGCCRRSVPKVSSRMMNGVTTSAASMRCGSRTVIFRLFQVLIQFFAKLNRVRAARPAPGNPTAGASRRFVQVLAGRRVSRPSATDCTFSVSCLPLLWCALHWRGRGGYGPRVVGHDHLVPPPPFGSGRPAASGIDQTPHALFPGPDDVADGGGRQFPGRA